MKKTAVISGVLSLLLAMLLLTGVLADRNDLNRFIRAGNQLFDLEKYDVAIAEYDQGHVSYPDNKTLNINMALAHMMMGRYEEALNHFEAGEADHLVIGNTHYLIGSVEADVNEKINALELALESYKEGMILQSKAIDLKYNYEFVKKLLDDLKQEQREQEKQEQEKQEQEGQEEEGQEQENQEQEKQEQEKQEQEGQDSSQEQGDEETGESAQEELEDQAMDAIEQILKVLAQQEENSLKNNQEVQGEGEDDQYDW